MQYRINETISVDEIFTNQSVLELFKETWIGELVDTASQLRDTLQKKKQKTTFDLELLFD